MSKEAYGCFTIRVTFYHKCTIEKKVWLAVLRTVPLLFRLCLVPFFSRRVELYSRSEVFDASRVLFRSFKFTDLIYKLIRSRQWWKMIKYISLGNRHCPLRTLWSSHRKTLVITIKFGIVGCWSKIFWMGNQ